MTGIPTSFTFSLRLSFDRSLLTISSIPLSITVIETQRFESDAVFIDSTISDETRCQIVAECPSFFVDTVSSNRSRETERLCESNGKTEREDGVRKKYRRSCV